MPATDGPMSLRMPTTNRPINAGSSMDDDASRIDAWAKVTGQAVYGRDRYLPNALFVMFVRCPYGSAQLESFDKDAAMAVPGVVEVDVNGKDGQYHGHTVGYVAADSLLAMRRGVRALKAVWKRREVKTRITEALPDFGPTEPAIQQLIDGAEMKHEAVYTTEVQTHCSLETHGAVIDHNGDEAKCYISTQGTFAATDGMEEALGLPRSKYEVICEYVGGGFGSKLNGAGKEGVTAGKISARLKRPVYLFCSREEDQTDTGNRPGSHTSVRIGFSKDGTILGGEVRTCGSVGVGRGGGGVSLPSGRYRLGNIKRDHRDVQLSAGSPRAFRAPGAPQAAFVEELMLDEVAHKIGMDPLQLRLKICQGTDRREMLDMGGKLIGWDKRVANGSSKGTVRRGFGCGTTSWFRGPARTRAEVVVNRDGSVVCRTGTQDIGTGQRTIMAIVAADALGINVDRVSVQIGRSSLPPGPGSGGSVTAPNSCPAMAFAGRDAGSKLLAAVASKDGGDASEYSLVGGAVHRAGKQVATWEQACSRLGLEGITGTGEWDRSTMEADESKGHSDGAQFVDLEVDTETGVVRVNRVVAIQACGRVVCRKTAESQVIGGVIQGVSYALFENRVLDRNAGTMLNANMEMYKILGTADMPHIEPVLFSKGGTGVRSLGEPPTIPTAGAIACAVFNSIGTPVRSLPLMPDRILAAIEGGAA
jgi:xanthine dehydrogenase YagR molybdenum-binding subunit